jgi:polar amino acid transport system substrate-binding protein
MHFPPEIIARFAPTGRLRAAINLGNPILAGTNPENGAPRGVSVDLAQAFADRLGVGIEFVAFDGAAQSVQALDTEVADIGFFAIDPLRGAGIHFTAPYVLIEGCYLVRSESPVQRNEEVDAPGRRIVVGQGSAYDLFLTRELKHASIVRARNSQTVVDTFVGESADVAAGVRQQLQADAQRLGGVRLLSGRFMVIEQAMGVAKTRGTRSATLLADFVEDMKASGFVAEALARHHISGAAVAPLRV